MVADLRLLVLRFVITALFVVGGAECAYTMYLGRRCAKTVISQCLHIAMAMAVAAMAWPARAALTTTAPMLLFLLATGWFAVFVLTRRGHRAVNAYHALMMLAMVWMYAAMSGSLSSAPVEGQAGGTQNPHEMTMPAMPGMAMPGTDMQTVGDPPLVTGLNRLCVVGFTVAAVWWLAMLVGRRRAGHPPPERQFVGTAAQAMMAAGMALMFGLML